MLGTCPEVIVSVGSAAEADSLLATFLSAYPKRESASQWLREEAIPQAIRSLMEQVMESKRSAENIRLTSPLRAQASRTGVVWSESPLTPSLSPLPKGGEGEGSGGIQKIEISIWLTTNDEIASLNTRYRGIDAPTDVLSFPAGTILAPIAEIPLGDVVVSVEQAAQQAEPNGHDFVTELLMLCLHGTLHLLGYDDRTEAQRARMNQIAARTLRTLGYAAKEEWSSRHYER
jgi:probable rRNA maturation factor